MTETKVVRFLAFDGPLHVMIDGELACGIRYANPKPLQIFDTSEKSPTCVRCAVRRVFSGKAAKVKRG